MSRLVPFLKLTRFPLVFTAVADSAAAYLLTVGAGSGIPSAWKLSMLAVASACLYACGMVFNDVADHVRDRVLHPERPIPSKQVSVDAARKLGMALFIIADVAGCLVHFMGGVLVLALFILILTYDFAAKHHRLGGALAMGGARGANFALGIFAGALAPGSVFAWPARGPWIECGLLAGYVVFLTLLSTVEEKPSRGGILAFGLMMLAAPAVAVGLAAAPVPWAAVAAGALGLVVGGHVALAAKALSREATMRAVIWGVLGIVLLDAVFVLGAGKGSWGGGIAALLAPAVALRPVFRRL